MATLEELHQLFLTSQKKIDGLIEDNIVLTDRILATERKLTESERKLQKMAKEYISSRAQIQALDDKIQQQDIKIHRLEDYVTFIQDTIVPDNKRMIEQLYPRRYS